MQTKMCLILSVLLVSATVSEAQVLLNGSQCPVLLKMQQSFDGHQFSGTWYEMIRTKRWMGTEIECVTHSVQMGSMLNITCDTQMYSPTLRKNMYESRYTEVSNPKYGDGKQSIVTFEVEDFGTLTDLVLLDTDYTSFAVLWSCAPADEDLHFENTMIWTRDQVPKPAALAKGLKALDNNNLSRNYLSYTRHRNCPEFTLGGPDQGIDVVGTTASPMMSTMMVVPLTSSADMPKHSTSGPMNSTSMMMNPPTTVDPHHT